ncbi:hypothetical protein Drorol1_Dr00020603, partial [Drosera rotundifolia]
MTVTNSSLLITTSTSTLNTSPFGDAYFILRGWRCFDIVYGLEVELEQGIRSAKVWVRLWSSQKSCVVFECSILHSIINGFVGL